MQQHISGRLRYAKFEQKQIEAQHLMILLNVKRKGNYNVNSIKEIQEGECFPPFRSGAIRYWSFKEINRELSHVGN